MSGLANDVLFNSLFIFPVKRSLFRENSVKSVPSSAESDLVRELKKKNAVVTTPDGRQCSKSDRRRRPSADGNSNGTEEENCQSFE